MIILKMLKGMLIPCVTSISAVDWWSSKLFSEDFCSGAETGLLIVDDDMLNDYSCEVPEPTGPVGNYLKMIEPFK